MYEPELEAPHPLQSLGLLFKCILSLPSQIGGGQGCLKSFTIPVQITAWNLLPPGPESATEKTLDTSHPTCDRPTHGRLHCSRTLQRVPSTPTIGLCDPCPPHFLVSLLASCSGPVAVPGTFQTPSTRVLCVGSSHKWPLQYSALPPKGLHTQSKIQSHLPLWQSPGCFCHTPHHLQVS